MRRAWSTSSCCWWATITTVCATSMMVSAAPSARRRCGLDHASFILPTSFLTSCDDKGQRARARQRRTSMSDVLPGTTGQLASADRCGEGLKHVTGAAQARARNLVHLLRRLLSGHNRFACDGPGTALNGRPVDDPVACHLCVRHSRRRCTSSGRCPQLRPHCPAPRAGGIPSSACRRSRLVRGEGLTRSRRSDSVLPVLPARAVLSVRAVLAVLPVRAVLAWRADRATGTGGAGGTGRP